jgi:hypothetical protein
MRWPWRNTKAAGIDHAVQQLGDELDARRRHLEEIKSRTPAAEAAGARAQKLVTANGFTTAIAVSMERKR